MYIEAVYKKTNFGQNYCQIYGGNIKFVSAHTGSCAKMLLHKNAIKHFCTIALLKGHIFWHIQQSGPFLQTVSQASQCRFCSVSCAVLLVYVVQCLVYIVQCFDSAQCEAFSVFSVNSTCTDDSPGSCPCSYSQNRFHTCTVDLYTTVLCTI